MSNNGGSHLDEDGDASGSIELHNGSETAAARQGFGLSDDEQSRFKWALSCVAIRSGVHLLISAPNKERRAPAKPLHTNFRLQASDEER